MLISPAIVLSIVIASLYAAIFCYFWAKRSRRSVMYWVVALGGFGAGQILALLAPMRLVVIGDVHLVAGTICCWAAMFIAKWLKL